MNSYSPATHQSTLFYQKNYYTTTGTFPAKLNLPPQSSAIPCSASLARAAAAHDGP